MKHVKDESLLKLSLVTAVAGLLVLVFLLKTIGEAKEIAAIDEGDIGKELKVFGTISSVYVSKNENIFLKLADDSGEISVVVFKNMARKLNAQLLKKGDAVEVYGKIQEYEGELEIIPNEIRVID